MAAAVPLLLERFGHGIELREQRAALQAEVGELRDELRALGCDDALSGLRKASLVEQLEETVAREQIPLEHANAEVPNNAVGRQLLDGDKEVGCLCSKLKRPDTESGLDQLAFGLFSLQRSALHPFRNFCHLGPRMV